MTPGDKTVVALLAIACVLAWPASLLASSQGTDSATISGPAGISEVRLDSTRTVEVEGRYGTVTVETGPGGVRATDSCCADRLCVGQGLVSHPSGAVVCAPNGVVVTVGGTADGLDATVR